MFLMLQFDVRACDDGRPQKCSDVNVILNVERVDRPTFLAPFETTITENLRVGGSAMKINAEHPIPGVRFTSVVVVVVVIFTDTKSSF